MMDYRGLDIGPGLNNLTNVLEQGYRDRAALQKEGDAGERAMALALMQDKRARELKAQELAQQNERDTRKFANAKEIAQISAAAKGRSESGLTPKEQSQLRRDLLKTKEAQNSQAILKLNGALQNYEQLVDDYGYQPAGVDRGKIESAYADLKIKYKEAANLGALTGPDMQIIEEGIKPVGGLKSALIGGIFTGGVKGVKEGLGQIKKNLMSDASVNYEALKRAFPEAEAQELLQQLQLREPPKNNWIDSISDPTARSAAMQALKEGIPEAAIKATLGFK